MQKLAFIIVASIAIALFTNSIVYSCTTTELVNYFCLSMGLGCLPTGKFSFFVCFVLLVAKQSRLGGGGGGGVKRERETESERETKNGSGGEERGEGDSEVGERDIAGDG